MTLLNFFLFVGAVINGNEWVREQEACKMHDKSEQFNVQRAMVERS
jgi:hypothetical protein